MALRQEPLHLGLEPLLHHLDVALSRPGQLYDRRIDVLAPPGRVVPGEGTERPRARGLLVVLHPSVPARVPAAVRRVRPGLGLGQAPVRRVRPGQLAVLVMLLLLGAGHRREGPADEVTPAQPVRAVGHVAEEAAAAVAAVAGGLQRGGRGRGRGRLLDEAAVAAAAQVVARAWAVGAADALAAQVGRLLEGDVARAALVVLRGQPETAAHTGGRGQGGLGIDGGGGVCVCI